MALPLARHAALVVATPAAVAHPRHHQLASADREDQRGRARELREKTEGDKIYYGHTRRNYGLDEVVSSGVSY